MFKCSVNSCPNTAKFQCPVCQNQGQKNLSHFCSQDCFKLAWTNHKLLHANQFNPWPTYKFTGALRPFPYGPTREIPEGIQTPDYAITGIPKSELDIKNRAATTIPILSVPEQEKVRTVCRLAREILDVAAKSIRPGVTGDQIDEIVHLECLKRNCYPSPLNYQGFPKSCCVSVNEVICHGIPDLRPLNKGDIVNVDVTAFFDGYHGDLNETYKVDDVDGESSKLIRCAKECLDLAIGAVRPGLPYKELGSIIEAHSKKCGFSVVRAFCGHGIGTLFHGPPSVPHYQKNRAVGIMREGHVFTIEPMINAGHWQEDIWPDNWTAVTIDGKRSAQYEHTILVTKTGCEVLTAGTNEKRIYP